MSDHTLTIKRMGTLPLALMVVAVASPVGAAVAVVPLIIGYGNGIGAPGTFVLICAILVVFALGFGAMANSAPSNTGFMGFITTGLGKRAGMAAGLVAGGAYVILTIYVVALLSYFVQNFLAHRFGLDLSWIVIAVVLCVTIGIVARFSVRDNALITAGLLSAEFFILFAIIIGVLVNQGPSAFPLESFSPAEIFSGPSPGFAIALAFLTFIGFEITAVFTDHVRNPDKTIGRGTMLGVLIAGGIFTLSAWAAIAGSGVDAVITITQGPDVANLLPIVAVDNAGAWAGPTLDLIMLTSLFAALLAIFNATAHYLKNLSQTFAPGSYLARLHPKSASAANSSALLAAAAGAVLVVSGLIGLDPYVELAALLGVLGAVGVFGLEIGCALAIFVHFRRIGDSRLWTTTLSPLVAFIALSACLAITLYYFGDLAGATTVFTAWSPLLYVGLAVVGWAVGKRGTQPTMKQQAARQ